MKLKLSFDFRISSWTVLRLSTFDLVSLSKNHCCIVSCINTNVQLEIPLLQKCSTCMLGEMVRSPMNSVLPIASPFCMYLSVQVVSCHDRIIHDTFNYNSTIIWSQHSFDARKTVQFKDGIVQCLCCMHFLFVVTTYKVQRREVMSNDILERAETPKL